MSPGRAVRADSSPSDGNLWSVSPELRRQWRSFSRMLRTHYPPFLFGFPQRRSLTPVFVYHEVDPKQFEADLRFLSDNRYRTLTPGEFLASDGRVPSAVLLTFDDARRNFWDVAFPLLQQFGARATVFAPTYWIAASDGTEASDPERSGAAGMFMNWEQLRACVHSGLVDVQAHGHRHALVHTSSRLVGFASPGLAARHHIYDWPMRWEGGRDRSGVPPFGTPVCEAEPLLSARCRVVEDEHAAQACRDLVAASGGEAFFRRAGAVALLRQAYADAIRDGGPARRVEGPEFEALVRAEFERSSELLREQLGRAPAFFAYPWMLGSDLSLGIAADVGIHAVFGVGFDFRRARQLSGPVAAFGRLKGDWLRFLPGRGRLRLREVVPEKLRDFLLSQHLAH